MPAIQRNLLLGALALSASLVAAPAAAGLDGKTIGLGYEATGLGTTFDPVTVGSGVELSCPGSANACSILTAPIQSVDFGDLSISYRYTGNGASFMDVPVNGFRFTNLDLGPGLVLGDVQLVSTIAGLDMGRVTFGPDSIQVDMAALVLAGPQSGFDLTLIATPVPEPAAWAMLGAGLLAIAGLARRGRRAAAALG